MFYVKYLKYVVPIEYKQNRINGFLGRSRSGKGTGQWCQYYIFRTFQLTYQLKDWPKSVVCRQWKSIDPFYNILNWILHFFHFRILGWHNIFGKGYFRMERQFQSLSIFGIFGVWESAQMDMVSFVPPYVDTYQVFSCSLHGLYISVIDRNWWPFFKMTLNFFEFSW